MRLERPLFWLMLAVLIGMRSLRAVFDPRPAVVQDAIKQCLLSLIVLDAAVCFAVRGLDGAAALGNIPWTFLILALLVPTMWLGRWVYST